MLYLQISNPLAFKFAAEFFSTKGDSNFKSAMIDHNEMTIGFNCFEDDDELSDLEFDIAVDWSAYCSRLGLSKSFSFYSHIMLTSNTINTVAEFNVFNDDDQEYLVTIPYSWTPPKAASRDSYGVPLEPDDDNKGTIDYKDTDISVFSIDEDGKYTKLDKNENDPVLELAYDAFLGLNNIEDLIWAWHNNNDISFEYDPETEF